MDEFVKSLMENYGAFGIGLLMFLENIFPPIPSEIIMPVSYTHLTLPTIYSV